MSATSLDDAPFTRLLSRVRGEVDARLAARFARTLDEARALGADVEAMAEAVRDLTMRGGKRFRAAMVVAAFRAVDPGAPDDAALDAGVALELLQSYMLIHDDWMDQDETRRGGPSVHAMLGARFGSRDVGASSAVLAGDYASALAMEAIAGIAAPPGRVVAAMGELARIQKDAIAGQQLDVRGRAEDVERMHDLKTGSYTVRGPLRLGALLAGARDDVLAALARYARPLGVAFQLRDDLLGVFGEPSETGKPAGNDIRAGKRTLLVQAALASATPAGRACIEATLGKRDADDAAVREVVAIFGASGARRAVEARMAELADQAIGALRGAAISSEGSSLLAGATRAFTARTS